MAALASDIWPVINARGIFGPQMKRVLGAAAAREHGVSSLTKSPSE